MGQQAVRNADPSFRAIFSEVSPSSLDSGTVAGRRFAYGDDGPLAFSMPAAGSDDTSWDDVAVLLGFEHRDASTGIINEADTGLVVTANGGAQADTAQAAFGNASLLLDGTGDYLTLDHDALFSVANGDFTVEGWVRRNATKLQCIISKKPASGSSEWALFINNTTNVLIGQAFNASVAVVNITGTVAVASGVWTHVAMTRQGTTWRIFVDGVLDGSATESGTPVSNTQALRIGRDQAFTARDFNGHLDELRFTAGVARYTATFTPPAAPFPRI
jgi:hypothetical protein